MGPRRRRRRGIALNAAGQPGPANDLELDVSIIVRRIVLRDFLYRLSPLAGPVTLNGAAAVEHGPATGLELLLRARDETGLEVLLRFDRSEFVNVATTGLAMLDAADATEPTEGR